MDNGVRECDFTVFKGTTGPTAADSRGPLFSDVFSVSKKNFENHALEPDFGSPNGAKIEPKAAKKTNEHRPRPRTLFFHRFLDTWGLESGSPEPSFPSQSTCFPTRKRKPLFSTRNGFCIDFGVHLAPFWQYFGKEVGENPENIDPEPASKNVQFFAAFCDRFGDHFGSILDEGFARKTSRSQSPGPVLAIFAPACPFCIHFKPMLPDLGSDLRTLGVILIAF